jgi:hypothetical protein
MILDLNTITGEYLGLLKKGEKLPHSNNLFFFFFFRVPTEMKAGSDTSYLRSIDLS